ncbi:uncharacterized protein N7473_006255 [Penicillium subrubescens]|uniref:Zinc-regulated transporter 3 n=1 Tax=Penicillium subrubescens TaxID=1316194 RepID=A0A1Q5UEL1_9EURO|nr:uncharacterized protein N7473_006255 [Penicillium subrubescens]KAJ5896856.1 hypothetical protein N7473_006255 [Penicillium subrubescens]OKP10915.1 Zinc-regulated transporter 3 [Penicillium subrubescens]
MAANDLRGWVMSAVSGVACVLGSAVICADIVLRRVTHDKKFQIANSNNFLSASLCLSAGVMLFTSLYSMLPNSKDYLIRAGFSPSVSAYILTALFIAGVVIIRVASGFLHRFIPSHVVDCAHTHDGPEEDPERGEQMQDCDGRPDTRHTNGSTERTPLLRPTGIQSSKSTPQVLQRTDLSSSPRRRESLRATISRRISSLMGGVKPLCDENGPCYGFSQTCGRECTKVLGPSISPPPTMSADEVIRPELPPQPQSIEVQLGPDALDEQEPSIDSVETAAGTGYFGTILSEEVNNSTSASSSSSRTQKVRSEHTNHSAMINHDHHHHDHHHNADHSSRGPASSKPGDPTHHHHVPQNAFLSIGLQTSLAIALHKLPEGFITYATNHASPTLGLTVFLALFIHNIVEGFAMALPLYLALNSRWKAMFWSSLLGGISQPAGAGIAALWIWGSGHTGNDSTGPSWGVYGGMFAMTAGVMTSVALQLFSEGLGLTHHRSMGIGFAVAGMGLMGFSFALTA